MLTGSGGDSSDKALPVDRILEHAKLLYAQRLTLLVNMTSDGVANQSFVVSNLASFTEDLWFCLGHPIGCINQARADLARHMQEVREGGGDSAKRGKDEAAEPENSRVIDDGVSSNASPKRQKDHDKKREKSSAGFKTIHVR